MPSPPPSLRFRLAASAAVLVAFLGLAEAAARIVGPQAPGMKGESGWVLLEAHPTRLWALPAGTVQSDPFSATVNARGFRGSLPADPRPSRQKRILLLGDSSIFGHGVEDDETLDVALEAALAPLGVDADALNLGIPGYSSEQTLIEMEELGWSLEPDLLVIANLWSDNDIGGFRDADLLRTRRVFEDSPLGGSAAYRLLAATIDRVRGGSGARIVTWISSSDWPTTGTRRVPLPDYARNIDLLARRAAEHGSGAMFLGLCNTHRIRSPDAPSPWNDYFATQAKVAAHHGIPVVDACEEFNASGLDDPDAFFLDEMHPSARGVRLIARGLAFALVQAGWPWSNALRAREEAFPADSVTDSWTNFSLVDTEKAKTPQRLLFSE